MAHRITIEPIADTARAKSLEKTLRERFPAMALSGVSITDSYSIDSVLSKKELTRVAQECARTGLERYSIDRVLAPGRFAYAIEIAFLPGVTDNVAATARDMLGNALARALKEREQVYSSRFIFLSGRLARSHALSIAEELYNPLIERATVYSFAKFRSGAMPAAVPRVLLKEKENTITVNLNLPEAALARIGKEGIEDNQGGRRGPLALSLEELRAIQKYFSRKKRMPTDVELESLAQTWSEHCKHTIFNDPLDEVSEGIYRRYIKGATEKIRKSKGKKDFCVSVFTDNSGAISFDGEFLVTHKVETHNSPSALDPFGGAITAIVGVNRDTLGFGLGAKPIANVYGFCVADPRDTKELFRDKEKKQPLLSSRRILEGVVRGINAGGNQSGIPTPLGFVAVDPSYRGKPLVYGGTVGLIPRKSGGRTGKKLYDKSARPGDYIVMVGGRVGLDGIHGATFSSEALAIGSPATAVQIGDPITQKKLSDAIIREARDKKLYTSITDNGAGGLSCSVAEMARECGGAKVELEKVPLKYPGLSPWQIWISESQERMTLSVPKKNWAALHTLLRRRGVEATRIGEFTDSGSCVVRYRGKKVMDIELSFLHGGRPVRHQRTRAPIAVHDEPPASARKAPLAKSILGVLARPSVGSSAFISQQYDHEVQGASVTKPLEGRGRVNADAAVIKPLFDSSRGLVLSHGYCPWYSPIDAYAMAAAAIDTSVRNAICAGASRSNLAILDNFCWSSSSDPERLWQLKRAAQACFDVAVAYGVPFISGKDSMFNDFRGFDARGDALHIAALPTLLVSSIGVIPEVSRAMTIDLKAAGDHLYLLGETHDEMGGSEYFSRLSDVHKKAWIGGTAPAVDVRKNAKLYDALAKAIDQRLVSSAIGVGRGGLAVALAKTAIAGELGIRGRLKNLPGTATGNDALLFSESQGRVVVSVRPESRKKFEQLMRAVPNAAIGTVTAEPALALTLKASHVNIPLAALARAYRKPFSDF